MKGDVHVIPVNDLREHVESIDCWCHPWVGKAPVADPVIVHNSLDGRELIEQHGVN